MLTKPTPPCGIAARFPKKERDDYLAAAFLLPPLVTETTVQYIDRAREAGVLQPADCPTIATKSIGANALADRFTRCQDWPN